MSTDRIIRNIGSTQINPELCGNEKIILKSKCRHQNKMVLYDLPQINFHKSNNLKLF